MIRKIVKLDGSIEDFSSAKVNNWGIWAADTLGDKVDWSSIVMDAVAGKPESVTSQELQNWLIEECLNKKTWSYYLMAGRLYAILLRKLLYGTEGIPTIKSLHNEMHADGVMVKLDYSDEEYAEMEKAIAHDEDLKYPHFSLQYIREKYALKNRITKREYETPQFTYMRMAMALAEKEPKEARLKHAKNYYMLFSKKLLSAPTPNYVNLGTVHNGLASCCLLASGDNGTSLALGDYIANIMTQNSAGIGVNIMSRSIGDPIRNGLIIHQGKKPYIDAISKAIKANLQNGRGGAGTAFYSAFDPEADMISQLRNPRSTEDRKNRDLHYALLTNRLFSMKAAKGENVFTFNVYTAPDLYKAMYSSDPTLFETLYHKYEIDVNFKKNYINARDLLKVSLNEAYETGTAYLAFIDEINRNTPYKEPIHSSNLCVAPNTQILTSMGHITIGKNEGRQVKVWNGEEFSETTIVKTGKNVKLMQVNLSNGFNLNCTAEHKWYVKAGGEVVVKKDTAELTVGEELHDFELPVIKSVYQGGQTVKDRIVQLDTLISNKGKVFVSKFDAFKIQLRLTVGSYHEALNISNLLATLGVKSRYVHPNELIVQHVGVIKLSELGLDLDVDFRYSEFDSDDTIKVTAVRWNNGVSDTYCFTEPKRNMGTFNNILTGQCLEVVEPTTPYYSPLDLELEEDHGRGEIAMCSLAASVIDNIEATPDPEATYEMVAYYGLKMINYCIENNKYPFKHLAYTAKARRSAGMGMMGYATHLAKKGIAYSSEEGKHETHRVAERHFYHLVKASLRISKEIGVAPWIHKTKWPEGWLPIDDYKRSVDEIVEGGFRFNYDWEELRARIIENGGIAHSALCCYMPGESSSKAVGGTNSIYPARRPVLMKTDNAVNVRWAAPFSDHESYKYEYAYNIKTKDMIDTYAIFQKFTDQTISADLFRKITGDEKISSNEMLKDYFYMVKMGMKTRYYQNTETNGELGLDDFETAVENNDGEVGCAGGFCTL